MLVSDQERQLLQSDRFKSKVKLNRLAYQQMVKLSESADKYEKDYLEQIAQSYTLLAEAIEVLTEAEIKATKFRDRDLKDAIAQKRLATLKMQEGVIKAVYTAFNENTRYTSREISDKLIPVYRTFEVPFDGRGCAPSIQNYFEARPDHTSANKGWRLGKRLYPIP